MLLGMMLIVLEIFVPSAGIIGLLAFSSVCTSIGLAFYHYGSDAGFSVLLLALLAVPGTVLIALKLLPNTPMGERLLLANPRSEEVLPDEEKLVRLKGLVGKVGKAKTKMLPSGSVEIDGLTVDAVSDGMPIEIGQRIRVLQVRTNRVIVRAEDSEGKGDVPRMMDDVLSRPIESLGIDPSSDPLA
jgi:membrane-bound ClpP family serine protease